MNRLNATVLMAVVIVGVGTAQYPEHQFQADQNDLEQSFREAVQAGLPERTLTTAAVFSLNHSDLAIPILLEAVKSALRRDSKSDVFIRRASELIAYTANSGSIDAVADLCDLDFGRFGNLLPRTLDHAISREREYELAFYAVQAHPSLSRGISLWLRKQFDFPLSEKRLAKAILKREEAGISPARNQPLLRLLDAGTRQDLQKTLEQFRATQQQQGQQR